MDSLNMPKVTILTDNPDSWIMDYIEDLIELIQKKGFDLEHIFKVNEIKKGDVLFALFRLVEAGHL